MKVLLGISALPPGNGIVRWLVMLAVTILAATPPARKMFSLAGRSADALAKSTRRAVLAVGVFALLVTATISILIDFPEPAVHDEFSYILAGRTFAKGRLTNPKHELWEFFETIHVIHDPTYQSKYPPAQGLALAVGIICFGEPVAGVWLSSALACGSLTWMLLAWVPRRWAVAGGVLGALHPVMLYWNATFFGGAVAFAGAALLLGALRRLWDAPRVRDGVILGVGVLILANSRPFEGLLLCIPIAVALLLWLIDRARKGEGRRVLRNLVVSALLVLIPGFAWMGYYNSRVTGHPLLMPYSRHDQIYSRTPHFFFQDLRPPKNYSNPQLAYQHGEWEPLHWRHQQTFSGWLKEIARKTLLLAKAFFQPLPLLIALVMLPHILRRDHWLALAAAILLFCIIGIWGVTWYVLPIYGAPIAPLALMLLVAAMSALQERGGIWRIALQITLAFFLLSVWPTYQFIAERQSKGQQMARAVMMNTLMSKYPNEKHLVIVRYLPETVYVEWVYNGPDIDEQQVVWARDLGPQKMPKLLNYYKDRRTWVIDVGAREVPAKPSWWDLSKESQ